MTRLLTDMDAYHPLTADCKQALIPLFQQKTIAKNELLLTIGTVPKWYYYIEKGLFAYYYLADNGDMIIKRFFAEHNFMSSTAALIQQEPGLFAIVALEDARYIQFSAAPFRALFEQYHDLALFHINYLEKNWIVEKEHLEITLKYETAKERYVQFLNTQANIIPRLKQHHIASFLGITPTQLSRIKKSLLL
ncbi:Crp/Fnr family transcriptional regulator [Taibaiella sp. KBW10]|uniref:Crp/Fnr family transcriptional regulator n=1 Tax=Taibaiella sp. KBW10 TaxID=2153357 RepID=UPI000F5AC77F|nr:Crp/Fnr family transcriptional regulator [Taibaiella sp. KBW10]RQO32223.1 Crp/Fnr family transcriptional regulator [Taibaiella sp. KBW10]